MLESFSNGSFAALKEDGSVVVWGDSLEYGAGVTSDQINSGVIDIFSNGNSYAALKMMDP